MPATPTLRKSKRLESRANGPTTAAPKSHQVRLSTSATAKVTRKIRSTPTQRIQKKIGDLDVYISDSDDPPTVEEAFLLPLMQRQAMEELRVVKKANDKLAQELAEVKLERDQFFPIVAAVLEFLDCPICCHYMDHPVTLPCGHTFCKTCFIAVSETQRTHAYAKKKLANKALKYYCCPTCRTFTDRRVIPTTIYGLQDILAVLPTE